MTKDFLHGRTEAIRTVQSHTVDFVKVGRLPSFVVSYLHVIFHRHSSQKPIQIKRLHRCARLARVMSNSARSVPKAWDRIGLSFFSVLFPSTFSHTFGRHLYALYCLAQRERDALNTPPAESGANTPTGTSGLSFANGGPEELPRPPSPAASTISELSALSDGYVHRPPLPEIFSDPGWQSLNTSILSTSNCGNPALRLFGFGPVAADGYGIGYIIKDDGISV